jgi:hypothetical protein
MFKGLAKEVTGSIGPIENGRDDIFIVCASFEERNLAVVNRLGEMYRATRSVIFKYDVKSKTDLRERNLQKLKGALALHSDCIYCITCDLHDPLDGILEFQESYGRNEILLQDKNITIDITTFTKQYLLLLLRFVEKQKPKSVRLFYTEPEEYAVKWNKPLSSGLVDIVSLPTYGGHYYAEKEDLLILMLGYEGDRAYGIWERFAPHKTIILIGRPSYKNAWEGRVEEFNKKTISKLPEESVNYISATNPFEVGKRLNDLFSSYLKDFNISISPLGPKPQVVGCYLSIKEHPDVQVVYAIPKSYEEEYFSKRVGKIWEYQ